MKNTKKLHHNQICTIETHLFSEILSVSNEWKHYRLQLCPLLKSLFLLRATSPCLLSGVQLCCLLLSVGSYLGGPLNLGTVWATRALSAASSKRRIHGRRGSAGPASTSPWSSSSNLLALSILSHLLCSWFFYVSVLVAARPGWRHQVHFFDMSRSKGRAHRVQCQQTVKVVNALL